MIRKNTQSLSTLSRGQSARVTSLNTCGAMRRRFQDLGLIEGTLVECLGASPLGDPCAYLIRGAVIALRKSDADTVVVQVSPAAATVPARVLATE